MASRSPRGQCVKWKISDDDGNGEWLKQLQFGTDRVKSRTGPLFIALRELTDTEVTKIQAANVDPERGVEVTLDMLEGSPNCSMNFTTLIIESPCYFNQGNDKLDSAGCQVRQLIQWPVEKMSYILRNMMTSWHYWPFVKGDSNAELWCFLFCWPEPAVKQTIKFPVIWDAVTPFDTILMHNFEK